MTERLIYQHKSGEKMDNPEYEKFLLDIADDVAELVAVSENRKRFEQHSCDLGKKQAAYLDAKRRADEKHAEQKRIALTKPKLSQQISYLKSKGWVEADLSPLNMGVYSESHLKPPSEEMPPEPLAGFLSVLTHDKDIPDVVPRPKIVEALAYYYFSLATIHDKMRDEGYIPIHNNSEAKQLAKSVWATIEKLCVDRQFIIKTALDHVEADLARKKPDKLPCTREEFEQFKAFYETFKKLTEQPEKVADFEYEKQKLLCNVEKIWPRIEELCKQFDISPEREMTEENRMQAARSFARRMSGETDLPKPESRPTRKELITLALVKSEIDCCPKPGHLEENGLFPKNLAAPFIAKIKLPTHIQRRNKIKQILAAVLARLSEYFGEEIGSQASPEKPAGTEQDITPTEEEKEKVKTIGSINIQDSNVILGDVQAKNLQIGDDATIDKKPEAENPPETAQSTALGKLAWIRGLLWKLYDVTVKSALEWLWTKIFSGPT